MLFGMTTFTLVHVLLSLVGIATGFVAIWGMYGSRRLPTWTGVFLATTVATDVSGFFLPAARILPSHIVGVISLVVLAVALYALYGRRLNGRWRAIYVAFAVLAQYLDVFVLVAQLFAKVPALHALAPTQAEPPFAIAQGVVALLFLIAGVGAVRKFRPSIWRS